MMPILFFHFCNELFPLFCIAIEMNLVETNCDRSRFRSHGRLSQSSQYYHVLTLTTKNEIWRALLLSKVQPDGVFSLKLKGKQKCQYHTSHNQNVGIKMSC